MNLSSAQLSLGKIYGSRFTVILHIQKTLTWVFLSIFLFPDKISYIIDYYHYRHFLLFHLHLLSFISSWKHDF